MSDSDITLDLRARALLSEQIDNRGALIIDEWHAYLDADDDYPRAADALGVEISAVNDALWDAYQTAYEQAEREMREETLERQDINDGSQRERWLHTWRGREDWYYCISGINTESLYSESDDEGGFATREAAREAALAWLADRDAETEELCDDFNQ